MAITVKYSCPECGLTRREAQVPERGTIANVIRYMQDVVAPNIAADHRSVSPHCQATSVKDLMIPYVANQPLGSK